VKLYDYFRSSAAYRVRIARTGDAATSARVAWLIPFQHQREHFRLFPFLVWSPPVMGALLVLLLFLNSRRTNGGTP